MAVSPFTPEQFEQMSRAGTKSAAQVEPMDSVKEALTSGKPVQSAPLGPRPQGYVDLDLGAELLTQSLDPLLLALGKFFLKHAAGAGRTVYRVKRPSLPESQRKNSKNAVTQTQPARATFAEFEEGSFCIVEYEHVEDVPIGWRPGSSDDDFFVNHCDLLNCRSDFVAWARGLPRRRRGRPKDSGIEGDAALVIQAVDMKKRGTVQTANQAAEVLADSAKGNSRASKVDRLRKKIILAFRALEDKSARN